MDNKVLVAKLGRSVGLKGFVKLHNLSDFIQQFKKGASFLDKKNKKLVIKEFDQQNQLVLFEGFESLELAKSLTNELLYQSLTHTRQTCKLEKDEYFYFDIIACIVFEEDLKLGEVVDILETSASYLFLIKTDEELVKQGFVKEFYVPYADKYIQKVELENKMIFTHNAFELLKSL
ncbi:16S rRNA processing protein RimM [Campylobacter sp. MIT 12-5580]|uniref:ribosome maturation factor RimM n=1 Tax=Campylobacter sp. MIT 12-5580 TaxID=2040651 RepID=UPI0010F650D6|nr:ribosome maturation factor RimM [Campylobacter sp. MIT 12-5580]TKX28754.1 16S rRNA processing protein RimM [Campylobacter sp. MIT 12-5580]